jgi:prevent-host-death family protein
MLTFTSSNAKREFGEVLIRSQQAPVAVTRNGKPIAVVVSNIEYEALKRQILVAKLIEGELSGVAGKLDIEEIKLKARNRVGL